MMQNNRFNDVRSWSSTGIGMAIVLCVLVAMVSVPVFAVVVNFPDPGLEAAIRDAIGKPAGDIYDTDLIGLTYLYAAGKNITNLYGIQHCVDLTKLLLENNQIVDISPLSGLSNLKELVLNNNKIVYISPLSGLNSLEALLLNNNKIVDLTPLSGLTTLTILDLRNNKIADIAPLLGLLNLTMLNVSYNKIANTAPLSKLPMLPGYGAVGQDVDPTITISVAVLDALKARITTLEVRIVALETRPQQGMGSTSGDLDSLADWTENEFDRLYSYINELYSQIDDINRKLDRAGIY